MTVDTLWGISQLPDEVIEQIIDYIQPFSCQIKLMPIPVFQPFIIQKLCYLKKWIVSNSSMNPIIINKLLETNEDDELMPVGYIRPVAVAGGATSRNFKNIQVSCDIDHENEFLVHNIGSLIDIVKRFNGYFPKNIMFKSFECFKECLIMYPSIINNALEVTVKIAKFTKSNSQRGDRYWTQVNDLINLECDNVTRLEIQYVDLTDLKLDNLTMLKSLKYLGQIDRFNGTLQLLDLNNLESLELTDIIVDGNSLNLFPENLQSLKIEKIRISHLNLQFPFKQLYEFLAGFELLDENSVIDLNDTFLNEITILGCDQLVSLDQLKLPTSITKLSIENCYYLWEMHSIEQYTNLKSFKWSQALLSLDFYLSTTFPDSLTHLAINGQDSKTDTIIEDLKRMIPNKFEFVYGINCFRLDEEFRFPNNLTNLTISNCRYLTIDCSHLELPNGLKYLTLLNLANLINIDEFKLPKDLICLNLNSNKIKCVQGLKIPKNLRVLKLDDNRLEQIPECLISKSMNKLTQISLTDNLLT